MRTSVAWRCAALALFALSSLLVARRARADDTQQFDLVKGLSETGQYEEVIRRLAILLDPSNPACSSVQGAPTIAQTCHISDGVLIERCHEMELVALVGLKRDGEADAAIEKLLRQNPSYVPDPASLPAAVITRVRDIKARMQKELEEKARKEADEKRKALLAQQKTSEEERKWIEELTKLASKETVIERRSRIYAFVPFGVGQLQNGDKGWAIFFATSEAVTGAASIGLSQAFAFYASADVNRRDPVTRAYLKDVTSGLAIGNQIAFGVWAALTIAGIVQANVVFEPTSVTTRERPLPKRPTPAVTPVAAASPDGLSVGLVGSF